MITGVSARMTLTIYEYLQNELTGIVYNDYLGRYINFSTSWEMISVMEDMYNELAFPQASANDKQFISKAGKKKKNIPKKGDDMEIKDTNGKAKFIVNVQFRQNATWQGTIQWVEENKTQNFRSALEMLKLMDEALESSADNDRASFKDA